MSSEATYPREHFLSRGWDLKSWLLTKDHKRIGILYLLSISAMFVLGGLYAGLIRWNLLVPDGSHMSADTYNKTFTAHGVIMVFFFLIPAIPAVLGNFLVLQRLSMMGDAISHAVLPGLALTLTILSLDTLGRTLANVLEDRREVVEEEA